MQRPALALLAVLGVATPARAGEHWPLWPSEVTRLAEPLFAATDADVLVASEASKLQALRALERYPTALVTPALLAGLGDRAVAVRREALQACLERTLHRCIPAAVTQWQAGTTPDVSIRIAAMRVLALDAGADPAHAELVIAALRDPDESVRAEAAHTLARVAWPTGQVAKIRTVLIGKLVDTAPAVRRAAARGLGLIGPPNPPGATNAPRAADPAPLALARLLPDPDPQVRQDAAEALGALRDPRAAPPLIRALDTGDEAYVSRAMVLALALLPGPDVDAALLRLLDAPPRGLTYRVVAEALGRRPDPGPAIVDGLVARLREDALQSYVFEALLLLGDAAAPALRAARERGLEPPLDLAVGRLLAALAIPAAVPTATTSWPNPDDRDAWHRHLAGPDALTAAAALADLGGAPWLRHAAAGALAHDHGPALRRPWLLALAASHPSWPADDPVTPVRIAAWAADPRLPALDRCLALAALASPGKRADPALVAAAADRDPAVRACAAAVVRDPVVFAGLLRDESPRVRATASFVLAACPLQIPPATQSLVAALATRDPHPGVLRAAQAALVRLADPDPTACRWQLRDVGEANPSQPLGWVDLEWRRTPTSDPQPVRLPVHLLGDHRWLLVPGADRLTPVPAR